MDCALLIESLYCMRMYIIHGLSPYICIVLYCMDQICRDVLKYISFFYYTHIHKHVNVQSLSQQ